MHRYPASSVTLIYVILALTLPYSEHLSPTSGTYALSCRFTILHGNGLGILHLLLSPAFHTIPLHLDHLLFFRSINHLLL